ncbi:Uncharacterised protein [Elizabethkingia miricola]|nr:MULTISPECIES: hypothetical protein [Elizabethkingia]SPW29996.1 Uncharacterised protein [Elizabethkingia miricola]
MKKIDRKILVVLLAETGEISKDYVVLMGNFSLGHVTRDVQMD